MNLSRTTKLPSALFTAALLLAATPVYALQPLDAFQRSASTANHAVREAKLTADQRSDEAGVELGRVLPAATITGTYTRNQVEVSVARPGANGQTETAIISPLDQLDATFSLRVPVIDVGGWLRLGSARANEEAARHRAQAVAADEEAEIARHYYSLVEARWLEDAASRALAAAEQNLSVVEERREVERALETDVLRARAEVERARRTVAEVAMQARAARRALWTATGLEPESGTPELEVPEAPRTDARSLAAGSVAVAAAESEASAADRLRQSS